MKKLVIIFFLLGTINSISSQTIIRVFEKDGNIFCQNDKGEDEQLTFTGIDSYPTLARDTNLIAFVRKIPRETPITSEEYDYIDQIWLMDYNNDSLSKLFEETHNSLECGYGQLLFGLENKDLYFMAAKWATSRAIYKINISSRNIDFVTDSNHLELVKRGKFKGCLITRKHDYLFSIEKGSFDWYWIETTDRELIAPFGYSYNQVHAFKKNYTSTITYNTCADLSANFQIDYPIDWICDEYFYKSDNSGYGSYFHDTFENVKMWVYTNPIKNTSLVKSYDIDLSDPSFKITYDIKKENWYVISGLKEKMIFYKKVIKSNIDFELKTIYLEYPQEFQVYIDQILMDILNSFSELEQL